MIQKASRMSDAHQTVGIDRLKRDAHVFHEHVVRNWGRIVITRDGAPANRKSGDIACVLISKSELDHLERALEIFYESPGGSSMCEQVQRIAAESFPSAARAVALGETQPDGRGHKAHL